MKTPQKFKDPIYVTRPHSARTDLSRKYRDSRNLIFLISLPRSGSTLFQRILSGCREIHSTSEPWLMLHPLHAFKTDSFNAKYDQNLAASAAKDFLSQIPENMDLYYQAVSAYGWTFYNRALEISGKQYFLDKTPRYYTIIPELLKTFPDARYVILLRNPMAVLSSVLDTWCNNDPAILTSTSNYRDLTDGPRALIEGINLLKDKAAVVHYEDLVSDPRKSIKHICKYLGVTFDDEMLEYGRQKPPKGQFGDTVSINQHQRPVNKYINKWIANFSDAKLRTFAADYLNQLGTKTFTQLGYDFVAVESVIRSLHDQVDRTGISNDDASGVSFLLSSQSGSKIKYDEVIGALNQTTPKTMIAGIHQFLHDHPDFPEAHNDLGILYCNTKEHAKALEHYRKAVSIDGKNVTFQKNLADFLFLVMNDIRSALEIYTRLLEYNRKDTESLYAIGQISLRLGKVDDARTFFKRIKEIFPKHADADQALCLITEAPHNSERTGSDPQLMTPVPQYSSEQIRPSGNEILIATSLAPHAIDLQKKALQSWLDLGFDVVSLNSPKEIEILNDQFPEISFHAVERHSKELFGKPFIFFDDFLNFFQTVDRSVYGIVNSDIHLKASKAIGSFLKDETIGSIVYGSRLDVPTIDNPQGDFYRNGFDFFFFDRSLLTIYPESIVSIGVTWWDYWAVLIPALRDYSIKKIVTPFAYHVLHPNRWVPEQWDKVGRHVSDYLKAEDIEKGQTWAPDAAWTVFREMLENCAAVKCLDKTLPDIDRRRFVYGDISSLNICILDFLDRISIETMLPWDESTHCRAFRSKGANFYPNFLGSKTEDNRPAVASEVIQSCTRSYKRALILYRENNSDAAETILKEITTTLPGYPPASNLLGVMLWERGSKETALQYFNAALHYDPYDRPTVVNCATAMIHLGKSEAARQLTAAYLRFNPGDLEIGHWQRELEVNGISSLPLQFCLHRTQNLQELPLLVYQMGKVGSTSIINSIEQYGIPTKHVHTLSWPGIEHAEELFGQNHDGVLPAWVQQYRGIRAEIDRLGKTGHWKIITLVRDPLRRYVSELFQNLDRYFPNIQNFNDCDISIIKNHIHRYLESFDESKDHACSWFDKEIKAVFNIDVFAVPFDVQRGFQRYHTDRADILLIRLENLSNGASEALADFLSVDAFQIINGNIGQSKPYAPLYRRVMSELTIDRPLIDRFYDSRLTRHFYSEAEIETFKTHWVAPHLSIEQSSHKTQFRVSAVVSTYSSERFIEGRLQNLVDQTLFKKNELEIIVIDSNSPENERRIVAQFQTRYPNVDYRCTPQRETVYAAWNRGIDMAHGSYFVNANTDDRFAPDALEAMADMLDTHPDYDAAYGNWVVTRTPNDTFDSCKAKRLFEYPDFHPGLFFYLQITSHANFVRRSVFDQIGNFDGFYTVFGDREFMFRFSAAGFKALKLGKTIGLYLENPTSVERANKDIGLKECNVLYDYYLAPERFAGLMGHAKEVSPRTLSKGYTEVGCFGMGLYCVDGKSMHALGSPTQLFAKAIELDPDNVEALNNMGVIAQHRCVSQDAVRFFKNARAIAQDKQKKVIDHNLESVRQGISDPDQLRFLFPSGFRSIKVTDSKYPSRRNQMISSKKASIAKPKKRAPVSIPNSRRKKKQTSNSHGLPIRQTVAWNNYLKENFSSALEFLQDALVENPEYWEAYELLVDVMLQSGQDVNIPETLRPLENRSDVPANTLALIGSGYEVTGDLSRALQFADRALAKDANCARGWSLKGVIEYRHDNRQAAARYFQKASDCDANWGDPWTNLGIVHWDQGETDTALDCFEKGFGLSATDPHVATTYHSAVSESAQYERARASFENTVNQYPDFRKARFLLIDILIHLEAHPDALDQIEAVLVRFGTDPQLLHAAKVVRNKVGPLAVAPGKHPSLSLCMIVKNEEKYLPRCLKSLKPIVDEMIVVDTGSTDATRDIAEVFGARVFDFEWNDDFSAARNFSLEQASGDWILVMDADEIIATKDHGSISKLLSISDSNRRAFMIVTRNYTNQYNNIGWEPNVGQYPEEETGTGWIPSEKVRLFPNDNAVRFQYHVHEVVGPSLRRKGITINACPYPVHHYGKLDQISDRQKDERYYKIGMDKLSGSHDDPVAIREMAVQAAKLGKDKEAILLWKRMIELEPNDPRSFINMASSYGKRKQYPEAKTAARKAIKLDPHMKDPHLNLGLSELHLGNITKAEAIFEKLVNNDSNYHSAVFLLSATQLCRAKTVKAIKTLKSLRGMSIWSSMSYSFQELIESLIAAGWIDLARNLIDGAVKLNCSNEAILGYRRRLQLKNTTTNNDNDFQMAM